MLLPYIFIGYMKKNYYISRELRVDVGDVCVKLSVKFTDKK